MPETCKACILALAKSLGFSESYGALLLRTAAMSIELKTSTITSKKERRDWESHLAGLVDALHCIAMQEQHIDPDDLAEIVDTQLSQARAIFQHLVSGSGD